MKMCPLCSNIGSNTIYSVKNLPLFQNKVFETSEEANNISTTDIDLVTCEFCGFVYNESFTSNDMNYDENYHNEQHFSPKFQEYLLEIVNTIIQKNFADKNIVEIGCGKAYFFDLLKKNGFQVKGFDPAYEGNDKDIIKDYFSQKYSDLNGELIILRHTLEHIEKPFVFLKNIAKSNNYKGYVFIEVPNFNWIIKNNAYWDIFNEHCNYFTEESLGSMFREFETGELFGGQYIYILAQLSKLKKTIIKNNNITKIKNTFDFKNVKDILGMKCKKIIWGGASKGVTFLNIFDKNKENIDYVIDINPLKQNKFIAGTGHKIVSPNEGLSAIGSDDIIIIMNENYYNEIKELIEQKKINTKILILGKSL